MENIHKNLQCEQCDGRDFYENTGFLFCNECGTQAEALKELGGTQVADNEFSRFQRKKIIKQPKVKKDVDDLNQLTSWECYNYILVGLVDELMKLGASPKLKKTVHVLWMKYLTKLEVLLIDAAPKLGLSSWKKDAKILYNYEEKKVRKSNAKILYENADSMSKEKLKRLKSKQRRSAIMENYKNCTALDKSDTSVLEFEPENVLNSTTKFEYNASITKEMEKAGLKRKRSENDADTSVRKMNTTDFSFTYLQGADNLSRAKIYAIIYLSLLIGNEEIQLGDMLRFIREGHLSYFKVNQFLPSMIREDDVNIENWNKTHTYMTHFYHREVTLKVAKYLDVTEHIPCQNLVRLCRRYCKEMNLPAGISDYIINLMTKLTPTMTFKDNLIPNYEGRVMSLIMFTLKLMFGLDDKTENHLSTYAQMLNERKDINEKMFVWKDWIYYIHYRKLVLIQHHFPLQYEFDNEGVDNVNLFIDFVGNKILENDDDFDPKNKEDLVLKEILDQLNQNESDENLNFSASLVPLRDYVKVLLSSKIPYRKGYLTQVLDSNFDETSLKFLTDCDDYIEILKKDIRVLVKETGAHEDIQICPLTNVKTEMDKYRRTSNQEVSAKIIKEEAGEIPTQTKNEDGTNVVFHYGLEDEVSSSSIKIRKYVHYKPYKTYWSTSTLNITEISKEDAKVFIRSLPDSFQLVLNECARIIEQEPLILMEEFMQVEAFLCRISDFENFSVTDRNAAKDPIFKTMMTKALKNW